MSEITAEELTAATGGKYHVKSVIGQGGMGTVYLAEHRELGSLVAIKVLPPEVRLNPMRMARFTREAGLSARLSHPNLVQTFELDTFDDIVYLVMPYIDGVSLAEHLDEHGAVRREEVDEMARQIGSGLAYAHQKGIVHRDVKPGNILHETATGRWLLTDFGVAHVSETDSTDLTASDATIGTLSYMAPEQLGGSRDVDGRADLYSLATVTYEALAGDLPDREGAERCALRLHELRPELPLEYCRAVSAPLATARDERPSSVEEWLARLIPVRRRRRFGRVGFAAAAAAAAAAAIAIGIGNLRDAPQPASGSVVAVMPFDVTGSTGRISLDSVLSQAVAWQLQMLPGIRVIEDRAVLAATAARFGGAALTQDDRVTLAAALGAHQFVVGRADARGDSVDLRIELYDAGGGRFTGGENAAGPLDSLHTLISDLVISTIGTQLAEAMSGAESPSLPRGVPAVSALFQADRAFRRGDIEGAVALFDRVIALDPGYAPAYFKRMVATVFQVRPTAASAEIYTALAAAEEQGPNLDPMSRRLLEGYSTLIREGDFTRARRQARDLHDDYPEALDPWFLRGALQAWFPVQMESSLAEARNTLNAVLERDPVFAPAHALLFQITASQDDRPAARRYRDLYLSMDSTSARAETIRLADSMLARPEILAPMLRTFATRPNEVLENLAVAAGELRPPSGTRAVASHALDLLVARGGTIAERSVTTRMRLATYLGSGQVDRARDFLSRAFSLGAPRDEVDRWSVLSGITPIIDLAPEDREAAARRLLVTTDDPATSRWLAARFLAERDSAAAAEAEADLNDLTTSPEATGVLATSLAADLRAHRLLARGDSAGAIAQWQQALSRYSVEHAQFGLVGSLWPLRWDLATVYAARERWTDAIREYNRLTQRAGFIDQVVWTPTLLALADASASNDDPLTAQRAYTDLRRVLGRADGEAARIRDSVAALLDGR